MNVHSSLRIAALLIMSACAVPPVEECTDPVRIADLPAALDEASGIVASRSQPDVLWAHNDSEGTAMLYALDRQGTLLAEIALPEAGAQFDWEDIAAGPCPTGHCLYIGDIGDNLHSRADRAILRIAEPSVADRGEIAGAAFPFAYPDGAEDAEAMFVMPDTTVYIVTKGRRQPITLYRYPPPLRAAERVTLERVQQLSAGIAQLPDLVTGADAAPDGHRIIIRTYTSFTMYRFDGDSLTRAAGPFDLSRAAEPQGEGVALAGDTVLLVTETGPFRAQPFLASVLCTSS